ncbi:hypothetical protein E3N88_39810 [Mikania micrantha]|uniref:Uncharacterized protein n=1 Tax=Mikania micrantha TaxID=192012 RepID=A0A5N6LKU1_9ASTR|nr:hypothetical protein E3N88_39810 [Mikania micrantha]
MPQTTTRSGNTNQRPGKEKMEQCGIMDQVESGTPLGASGCHLKRHLESRTPPGLCRRHPKRHSGVWDATGLSTDATQEATSCWNGYEWGG